MNASTETPTANIGSQSPVVTNNPAKSDPTSPRIAVISDKIRRTVFSKQTSGELIRALLDETMRRREITGVACFIRKGDQLKLGPHKVRQPRWQAALETELVTSAIISAVASRKMQVARLEGLKPATMICIPVTIGDVCAIGFLVASPRDSAAVTGEVIIAELLSVQVAAWHDRTRSARLSRDLSATAALLELVRRVEAAEDLDSAGYEVVTALQEHLHCEQVVLGLVDGRKGCRVVAISGVAEVDDNAVPTQKLKAVLDEALVRDELSSWPPLPDSNTHQLLAHKQLARRDESVISVPLRDVNGKAIGALAARGGRELAGLPEVYNFIRTLDEPLGSALVAARQIQGTWLSRTTRKIMSLPNERKRIIAMIIACVVVSAMTIPIPYRIRCESVVEPVERGFCVAPYDGLLEITRAEPGDIVKAGQPLAHMDGREVRLRLASIEAKIHQASKEHDVHRSRHDVAKAVMAKREIDGLVAESELEKLREQGLDIVSPIHGMVLSGSLDRRENYPVTKGQVLYEIAPLNPLRIEVAVPAREIPHVQEGMLVKVYFDGLESEQFEGKIDVIRPRSEVREQHNVFVAEVVVDNNNGRIRPGMHGRAKVHSHHRWIGWILFHRAWEKMRTAWPL